MIDGRCLCGAVGWALEGALAHMTHCHCGMCRKAHGSAFATYAVGSDGELRYLHGEGAIRRFASSPGHERGFCGHCGSVVPLDRDAVPAGNLTGDPGIRPEAHIFAASAPVWWRIHDALPRFDAWPPGFDAPVVDREPREAGGPGGGSCLCGEVRWAAEGEPLAMVNCHCSRCRLARSAAHATNLFMPVDGFRWLAGEGAVTAFKLPEAERFTQAFCERCGSPVPRAVAGAERVNVPAGGLDDDPGVRPMLHIHVASGAAWYEIADDLPRYPAGYR